jgi:hypothetical protein
MIKKSTLERGADGNGNRDDTLDSGLQGLAT